MDEMTLERACEIANVIGWRGRRDWEIRETGKYSTEDRFVASGTPPAWMVGNEFITAMVGQVDLARKVLAIAPPADAAEGDANPKAMMQTRRLLGLIENDGPLDNETQFRIVLHGSAWKALTAELRALLAAAEKAGPGPATRRLFENLSPVCGEAADHSKISFKNQFRVSGYVLAGVIREAARECGSEVPR